MATEKNLIEELNYLTDLLSNRARTLAAGVIAFCWLFILQNVTKEDTTELFETDLLLIPVALSILSLLVDAVQYWIGYLQTRMRLNELEKSGNEEIVFNHNSMVFRLRILAFYSKQLLVLVAVLWLLYAVLVSIKS